MAFKMKGFPKFKGTGGSGMRQKSAEEQRIASLTSSESLPEGYGKRETEKKMTKAGKEAKEATKDTGKGFGEVAGTLVEFAAADKAAEKMGKGLAEGASSGFRKNGNPKDFARQQKLKAGKLLESEHPDTAVIGGGSDSDDLYDRIEFIEETANSEGRDLTNAEKADIASLRKRIENL